MKNLRSELFCLVTAVAAFTCFSAGPADKIVCPGEYGGHLQGVATDGEKIYWSFTTEIVSTDIGGKLLAVQKAPYHQGDLCVKDGIVYVAVNLGHFNYRKGAVSQVTAYDAETLKPLKTWKLDDMPHGAGGITWRGDRFFVVGGLPKTIECNYVYEYTKDFELVKRHDIETGFTLMGIQTAAYEDGRFFFGIYGESGNRHGVLKVKDDLRTYSRFTGPGSVGILKLAGRYYVGYTTRNKENGRNGGGIKAAPGFCGEKARYRQLKKGGEVRFFFTGRDKSGWKDAGYTFNPDGIRTLSGFNAAYRPLKAKAEGDVSAVSVDENRPLNVNDFVRAVRRAAECNESLAVCFPGTPASVAANARLSPLLSAIRSEAARLEVKVNGL